MMFCAFIATCGVLLAAVVGLVHLSCFLLLVGLRWHAAVACWAERRRDFPRAVARDRLLREGVGYGPPMRFRRPASHYGTSARWRP